MKWNVDRIKNIILEKPNVETGRHPVLGKVQLFSDIPDERPDQCHPRTMNIVDPVILQWPAERQREQWKMAIHGGKVTT